MNLFYSLTITLFGIAGLTSAFEAFEDDVSLRAEVKVYCLSPSEYEQTDGGEKYGPIVGWNVSAVTNMRRLFKGLRRCNPPISNWNVGAVKNFRSMFRWAKAFDQDLSAWDVGKGRSFRNMFQNAATFNQDLSGWDVGNGIDFRNMFQDAAVFNQDLIAWDVGNGQNFRSMFEGTLAFNQDLSGWDVRNSRNFKFMFKKSGMNHFIGNWRFESMKNVDVLTILFSMLGATNCDDLLPDEWEQLNNFVGAPACNQK